MIAAPYVGRPLRPTRGLVKLITFVLWLVCDIDDHSSLFCFVFFKAAALKQQQRLFVFTRFSPAPAASGAFTMPPGSWTWMSGTWMSEPPCIVRNMDVIEYASREPATQSQQWVQWMEDYAASGAIQWRDHSTELDVTKFTGKVEPGPVVRKCCLGGSTPLVVQPAAPQRCRWAASGATEMPGGQPGALGWGQPAAQRAAAMQPVLPVIMKAKPKKAASLVDQHQVLVDRHQGFGGSIPGFGGSTPRVWWINTRFWWINTRVWWINTRVW